MRGVAQNHLGDDLRFRETQQVVSQVLVPVEKRCFLDELQFGIRILPKDNFAQRERIQSPPERRLFSLSALDDERNNPALFRQDFNDKARVAVRKTMQNNGTSFNHRRKTASLVDERRKTIEANAHYRSFVFRL